MVRFRSHRHTQQYKGPSSQKSHAKLSSLRQHRRYSSVSKRRSWQRSSSTTINSASSTNQTFPTKLFGIILGMLILVIVITFGIQSCQQRVYDWNNLYQDNDRFYYQEHGTITSLTGIDVSSHQGSIDWSAVKNDGIDFAFLRCGFRGMSEGTISADETFYTNADGAVNAGIPIGVYFFSQALNEEEAREEADYVLSLIAGMNISGPIAYDFEIFPDQTSRAQDLSNDQITANAKAFCQRIEEAGYTAIIYGNQHDLSRYHLDEMSWDIWYAQYTDSAPSISEGLVMWQYTSTGQVDGISTDVDLNILFDDSLF